MIAYWLFAAGVRLAEVLPARTVFALAVVAGTVLSLLPLPAARRLRHNLSRVTGIPAASARLTPLVRQVFRTHAQNYADLMRSRVTSPDEATRLFLPVGEGWEPFRCHVAARRGAVLVTAHFGRIEMLSHYLGAIPVTLTLPVERIQPRALFDLVCRLRTRPTFHLVPHDIALRPCLRALARGEVAVFFADWDPSGHGVPVQFFGATARLPAGPAMVARRAGVPIFVGFNSALGPRARLLAIIEPPLKLTWTEDADADIQRATQLIAHAFERYIGREPGRWVMFHEIWPAAAEAAGVVECGTRDFLGAAANG